MSINVVHRFRTRTLEILDERITDKYEKVEAQHAIKEAYTTMLMEIVGGLDLTKKGTSNGTNK